MRRTNSYLSLKTSKLQFLDIKQFLAPGFSCQKFLIAYAAELRKFYFSYEFVPDLDKFESGLPEHKEFYSSQSKSNIGLERKSCPIENNIYLTNFSIYMLCLYWLNKYYFLSDKTFVLILLLKATCKLRNWLNKCYFLSDKTFVPILYYPRRIQSCGKQMEGERFELPTGDINILRIKVLDCVPFVQAVQNLLQPYI